MADFITNTWDPLLYILGTLIRPLGGLLLGGVIGWLTASTFLDAEKEWQLKIAIFLGLLGAFVTLQIYSGAGTTGFFAVGAGVAAIILGVRQIQPAKKK
jgi:NhaP-type Na+/H+ or K+/H+ antiporter